MQRVFELLAVQRKGDQTSCECAKQGEPRGQEAGSLGAVAFKVQRDGVRIIAVNRGAEKMHREPGLARLNCFQVFGRACPT